MIGLTLNHSPAKFQVKNIYCSGDIECGASRHMPPPSSSSGCEMSKMSGLARVKDHQF